MSRLPPTAWVTADKLFAQAFGLLIFAIQAPVLGPHPFGVLAVVMVLVGFWDAVPGAAATDALISVRGITGGHLMATQLATVFVSVAAGLVAGLAAVPMAAAFGEPDLVPIIRAMAVLPLLQALCIAPIAAAQHEMLFRSLALRTIASQLAGGAVGLGLAFTGAGVWALVAQALVQRCVAVCILWSLVPMPVGTRATWRHLREVCVFASPNMVARIMSWSSGQLPRLILGFDFGSTNLSLFTLGTRLNDIVTQVAILPRTQVARVELRHYGAGSNELDQALSRVFATTGLIAFPLFIGGASVMAPLITCWLDARWQAAIAPCQVLLLMGVPFVTIYVSSSLLMALNRQSWQAVISTVQSIATLCSVAFAARYGVRPAAWAMALTAVATVPLTVFVVHATCRVSLRTIVLSQVPALCAAGLMGVLICTLRPVLEARIGIGAALPLEILFGGAVYVCATAALQPKLARSATGLALRFLRATGIAVARIETP